MTPQNPEHHSRAQASAPDHGHAMGQAQASAPDHGHATGHSHATGAAPAPGLAMGSAPGGPAAPVLQSEPVSLQTRLSYGYGAFGKDLSLALVNIFLFIYLTDVAGMSAAVVGIIFMVARIWDTVDDPLWGYIVSRINTPWGKYKPWILVGNIFNAVLMVACFCTHLFEGTAQIIYLTLVYIAWGIAYTWCDAPFWSLIPCISMDRREREGLLPWPRFAATIGFYAAGGCGVYAVHIFGQGDDGLGYMLFAAVGAFFALTSAVVTCKWTEESFQPPQAESFKISEAIFIVTRNRQFLLFLCIVFCSVIGGGIKEALNLYLFKYALHDEQAFSTMVLASSIAAIPALIFFKSMVRAMGRRLLFFLSITLPFVSAAMLSLCVWDLLPFLPMVLISGAINGFTTALYWSFVMIMVADTVDYGDARFNLRSESVYYSLHTLMSKCSGAFSSAALGFILTLVNYVPNVEQSEQTINALAACYWGVTVICLIGGILYLTSYRLNGSVLDDIQLTLTRRRVAAAAAG